MLHVGIYIQTVAFLCLFIKNGGEKKQCEGKKVNKLKGRKQEEEGRRGKAEK